MAGPKSNKKKKKTAPSKGSGVPATSEAGPTGSPAVAPSAAAVAPPPRTASAATNGAPAGNGAAARPKLDPAALLKRAQLLKEEGNKQFQAKRFVDALHTYEVALKFCPEGHEDRAVLHSNRAACYLQMKPPRFEAVVMECTLALTLRPRFPRALLRRAKGFEGLGRKGPAMEDLKLLLKEEPGNEDAKEILRILQEPPEKVATSAEGEPLEGSRGPSLPPKPAPKEAPVATTQQSTVLGSAQGSGPEESPEGDGEGQQQILLDDWYVELADMIRHRLGVDPIPADPFDAQAAEIVRAIEETVTSEEATPLLEAAEAKFANMAAMVMINWASTHRILATRKSGKKTKQTETDKDKSEATEGEKQKGEGAGAGEEKAQGEAATGADESEAAKQGAAAGGTEKQDLKEEGKVEEEADEKGEGDAQTKETSEVKEGKEDEVEAEETEDEARARQLADCEWALKHLGIALDKYEQAMQMQPNLVDSLAGSAYCLAEKARNNELQAELLAQGPQKVPLSPALAREVHRDYRNALDRFTETNQVLNRLEKEVLEQPHHEHSCTNPDHNHGHAEGGEGEHAHDEAGAQQFLDNLARYRKVFGQWWISALTSSALYEHKLGTGKWKANLQQAVQLVGTFGDGGLEEEEQTKGEKEEEEDKDLAAKLLSSLPPPLNKLTVEEVMGEGAEEVGVLGEEESELGSPWAKVWAQREEADEGAEEGGGTGSGAAAEEKPTSEGEAVPEAGQSEAARSTPANGEATASELTSLEPAPPAVPSESTNKTAEKVSVKEASTPGAAASPTQQPTGELVSGFLENLFKKKDREKSHEKIQDALPRREGSPQTDKMEGAAKKGEAPKGLEGPKREDPTAKRGLKPPPPDLDAVGKEKSLGGFDGDEPMTPVKDLVGKFTSWGSK